MCLRLRNLFERKRTYREPLPISESLAAPYPVAHRRGKLVNAMPT